MNLLLENAQITTIDRYGDGNADDAGATRQGEGDNGPVDIVLVNMPYCPITLPSLALGVLKACLHGTGIRCAVDYANLHFAEFLGIDTLRVVATARNEHLIGEWTFAGAAFPDYESNVEDAIGRDVIEDLKRKSPDKFAQLESVAEVWRAVRKLAPVFVDATARRILARHPRIVGCTSTFEQQTASLALLRRVKELDPTVVTMLGGANCESEMGVAVIQEFPWVDFAVSGEADEIFAPFCKLVMKKGTRIDPVFLPHGVLCAANVKGGAFGPGRAAPPRAVVEHMDVSPVPDFGDFFVALARSPVRERIVPALPMETSRGCWWGQKSHCTFCGLNGEGMRFRAKSPDRVLSEFAELSRRHGITSFQMADNILDMNHLRTVMPALAEAGAPYELFYEIKANLRREQVALLAASGVTKVQPGIEALHDGLLKLMAKGSTAAINIELLKHVREVGIRSVWLMLVGFPGEDDAWHSEVAAWLPLLHHLQPPADVASVRFDRFSMYHQHPERYDLDLTPFPAYSAVYPSSPERLQDLAYFFLDANDPNRLVEPPGIVALRHRVWEWIRVFEQELIPVLCATDNGDSIAIYDTRPVARARRHTLTGLEAAAYRGCEPAVSSEVLIKRLGADHGASEAEAAAVIASLVAKLIVLDFHGKLIALCVPGDVPQLQGYEDAPGGWARGSETPFVVAIQMARERLKVLAQQHAIETAAESAAVVS